MTIVPRLVRIAAPALLAATALPAPAAVELPACTIVARPQLICDGASCVRVSARELCDRYRDMAAGPRPAVIGRRLAAEADARRAMTRLVASIR